MIWLHVPAAIWVLGLNLPVDLPAHGRRELASRTGRRIIYTSSFVERYLLPVLYRSASRDVQWALGGVVIALTLRCTSWFCAVDAAARGEAKSGAGRWARMNKIDRINRMKSSILFYARARMSGLAPSSSLLLIKIKISSCSSCPSCSVSRPPLSLPRLGDMRGRVPGRTS